MTRWQAGILAGAFLASACAVTTPVAPRLALSPMQARLLSPALWSPHVSSPALALARRAARPRTTQAFPGTAGWNEGGLAGLSLSTLGLPAGDVVTNGPLAAYNTPAGSGAYHRVYLVSRAGKLVRVDRDKAAADGILDLGKTCSRTTIVSSSAGNMGYVLADDGSLFVIDLARLAILDTYPCGPAKGVMPSLDPFRTAVGSRDVLAIATNAGTLLTLAVDAGGKVSQVSSQDVAGGVTPLGDRQDKLAATPNVVGGTVAIGDQAGNLHILTSGSHDVYPLGAPIDSTPTLEIQDGSYHLVDPAGNPTTVPNDTPVYAFVTAGATCIWVDLIAHRVTFSPALRIDDQDPTATFGFLRDYRYAPAGETSYLPAVDGVNVLAGDRALPGEGTRGWSRDVLSPAQSNTADQNGQPGGAPVLSYLRFHAAVQHAFGDVLARATLLLTPSADERGLPPRVYTSLPTTRDLKALWSAGSLNNDNRPVPGLALAGYAGGNADADGLTSFKADARVPWDVSAAFPQPVTDYGLVLGFDAGDRVLWPKGPYGGGAGQKPARPEQIPALRFVPASGDGAPAVLDDRRPTLALSRAAARMAVASVPTTPLLDAVAHRVYVFTSNTLYSLDYNSPEAFADVAAERRAVFNRSAGPTGRAVATFDGHGRFIATTCDIAINFNGTAIYTLGRVPVADGAAPERWSYVVSKFALPLGVDGDRLQAGAAVVADVPGTAAPRPGDPDASAIMAIDPFTDGDTVGGDLYFALPNGRAYEVER